MSADVQPEVDDLVRQAVSLWGPRMILGGVDFNDFERATHEIRTWSEWIDIWCAYGDRHRVVGERFEAQEAQISAGNAYRRAAACYHFSKFVWVDDLDQNESATLAAVGASNRALRLLDPGHRRLEAGDGSFRIAGNLRVPPQVLGPVPVVVLIPGLDSTKEEFPSWEAAFLRRGMATFAVDGPGQGEVFHLGTRIQPAYERTFALAIEALASDSRINMDKIVVAGTSLGGLYAVRAGAFVDCVKAVVSISGPFKIDLNTMKPHSAAAFAFYVRADGSADAQRRLAGLDLAGVAKKLTKPTLFVTGKLDRIIAWEQTEAIARESLRGTFLLYDDGNHGLTNRAPEVRDLTADWLISQVA